MHELISRLLQLLQSSNAGELKKIQEEFLIKVKPAPALSQQYVPVDRDLVKEQYKKLARYSFVTS